MQNQDLEELLPLYVNNTLSGDQKEHVRREIETNESLRSEMIFLEAINDRVKSELIRSPGELGWRRLKKELLANNSWNVQEPTEQARHGARSWWKGLAVAASLAFVLQSTYVMYEHQKPPQDYRALSTGEYKGAIKVRFIPEVRESEIRRLLLEMNGEIVKGPSAMGLYDIRFDNHETATERLKAEEIVEYAEPAQR